MSPSRSYSRKPKQKNSPRQDVGLSWIRIDPCPRPHPTGPSPPAVGRLSLFSTASGLLQVGITNRERVKKRGERAKKTKGPEKKKKRRAAFLTSLHPFHEEVGDPQGVEKVASALELVAMVFTGGIDCIEQTRERGGGESDGKRQVIRSARRRCRD